MFSVHDEYAFYFDMSKSTSVIQVCLIIASSQHLADPPFPVYGGIFREEAIALLRRFYEQENEKGQCPLNTRKR